MTRNNKVSSAKRILIFILSILMCLSLFFAVACKDDDDSGSSIPKYTYNDKSDCDIANPDFTYGTANLTYADYPSTSITGWNFSKVASSNSGVIDISNKGWENLLSNLAKDSGILNYVRANNGNFTDTDIRNEMIEKYPDKYDNDQNKPTTSQIREYIVKKYFLLTETTTENIQPLFNNPGKHSNATDNKIYMLNNYKTGDIGYGCAQSLNSSTTITLNAGEYAKISVYVKTANLNTENTGSGYNKEIGANIRVTNSFNTDSQSDFGIFNIITDPQTTDWQEYVFYVKADSVYSSKFALVLGLGYNDYAAEGTAYFDDITVKVLDQTEYNKEIASQTVQTFNLEYKNEDNKKLQVEASTYDNQVAYLYDMSLDLANIQDYTSTISFFNNQSYYSFTKYDDDNRTGNPTGLNKDDVFEVDLNSNEITDVPYGIDDGLKVELKKPASVSIKLDNNGQNFKLVGESYTAITFFVKNQLNKLYAKDIAINVQDILGTETNKRFAVATISEVSDEWTKCTVIIKNYFKDIEREFYLDIVVGPNKYYDGIENYAKGTVYFSSPIIATGSVNQYVDDSNKVETPNYNYFNLLSSSASGDFALYTGNKQGEVDDTTTAVTYNFAVAKNDIGKIVNRPATPTGYTGIKSNHYYITNNDNDSIVINENKNSGLINTKYLGNYSDAIGQALNYSGEKDIQPLMITPLTDGTNNYSYGYISGNYDVLANSFAKVSIDIKVKNATAYVYLVDVSNKEKDVLTFGGFTAYTPNAELTNTNQTIGEKSLFFTVDDSTMGNSDWLTLEFYIATGANKKSFRVEMWNGSRSSTDPLTSNGYVFINNVDVITDADWEEPERWEDALTGSGNKTPLSNKLNAFSDGNILMHLRELTDIEKKFNNDDSKTNSNVVYNPKYIWAQNQTMIYAVYNTIEPTYINPYDFEPVEDESEESSLIQTDPAKFWLSFSSILLGVALVLAIVMLFIKNIRRRRKASKSDVKSHYTVRSRVKKPTVKPVIEEEKNDSYEPVFDDEEEQLSEENEQSLDDYIYGDVQDFGEDSDKE